MSRLPKSTVAAAAILSILSTTAAQASTSCWGGRELSAAHVRQMQTMLMVATLRCRAARIDISPEYNGFITAQNPAITAANMVIKQHFAQAGGAQSDYDRFATSLANGYGDDDTSAASCAEAAALAHEAAAVTDAGALDRVVAARLFPAALPGGLCEAPAMPIARAAPSPVEPSPLPPLLALAAPEPLPATAQPVALPAEVLAALAVMARFHDAQTAPAEPAALASPAPTRLAAATR